MYFGESRPPDVRPACWRPCVCVALSSPFVQQLQFDTSRRHHPPEAAVVAVNGQSEALVIFWRSMEKTHTHSLHLQSYWNTTMRCLKHEDGTELRWRLTGGVGVLDDGRFVSLRLLLAEGKNRNVGNDCSSLSCKPSERLVVAAKNKWLLLSSDTGSRTWRRRPDRWAGSLGGRGCVNNQPIFFLCTVIKARPQIF